MAEFTSLEYKHPSFSARKERITINDLHVDSPRFVADEDGVWHSVDTCKKDRVSILIGGDLLCQEDMIDSHKTSSGAYDFSTCFDFLKPLLNQSDLAIGNLETPVSETAPYRGEILSHEGPYYCNAPLEYLSALRNAGFDFLTTANNHTLDAGEKGLLDTVSNVRGLGFIQTGTFRNSEERKWAIVDICGFKVGFTAFATSYNSMEWNLKRKGRLSYLNTFSEARARKVHAEMVAAGAELTVCMPHWGAEYTDEMSLKQQRMADALVDAGYDVVAGSHAHVVQRYKRIAGIPVAYSMGNLLAARRPWRSIESQYSMLCKLDLYREGSKVRSSISFIPLKAIEGYHSIPLMTIPYSENADYDSDLLTRIADAPEHVLSALDCKESLICKDAAFTAPVLADIIGKVTALTVDDAKSDQDIAQQKIDQAAKIEAKRETDPERYIKHESGILFDVHDGIADAVEASFNSAVLNYPSEIDEIPVRSISNEPAPNDVVRIVYIKRGVGSIAPHAFEGFRKLEGVRLFNGLRSLGDAAFKDCVTMTGICLPETLESIGDACFSGCSRLRSIEIPPNVRHIGSDVFSGCDDLTIYCERGSFAYKYAVKNEFSYVTMPLTQETRAKRLASSAQSSSVEQKVLKPGTPSVVMGPMNTGDDPHPITIRATCEILGCPLPDDAVVSKQPSAYLGSNRYAGLLSEVKALLGDRYPKDLEDEDRSYRLFKSKFRAQRCVKYTNTDFTVYFCDWLLFARDRGFTHNCYFDYELYNKEPDIRDTFLNEGFRIRVHKACAGKTHREVLLDKAKFNEVFAKYVNRDWIDASTCSFDEFKAFVERHDRFFGKPVRGTGGQGAHVIKTDVCPLEDLYESCRDNQLICEDVVRQHPDLAKINASTLNTVRVNTLLCADGTPRIVLTVARFGRSGKAADNFHAGGVGAIVDIESGVIITEAINMGHERSPFHPDSGEQILGFRYPEWDKIKEAVCEAATMIPEMRNIGWDVSVTEDGKVEFIEGNGRPNYDVLQSPDQVGRRFRYEPYLSDIERMNGIEPREYEPLVVTLKERKSGASLLARLKRKAKKVIFSRK